MAAGGVEGVADSPEPAGLVGAFVSAGVGPDAAETTTLGVGVETAARLAAVDADDTTGDEDADGDPPASGGDRLPAMKA